MSRRRTISLGVALILVGTWALLRSFGVPWTGLDQLWPAILVIIGIYSLYSAFDREPRDLDSISFGITAILAGGLFFYITIGPATWSDLRWLWPAFPAIAGIGWLASWFFDLSQVSDLVAALLGLAVGGIGFLYTYGVLSPQQGRYILNYWPVALIAIGLALVIQHLVQRR